MRLDCLARRVGECLAQELYRLFRDPARSIRVADNLSQRK
jgi:hypothetical protein